MKKVTFVTIALLCLIPVQAQQKIEKHISFAGKDFIHLNIGIADSIRIKTWSKNEVFAIASVNINGNKDNDVYVTSFDEGGNSVIIDGNFRDNYFKGKDNNCIESDITWLVYIPEKIDFEVETINADITIDGKTEGMRVKSISGYIDLSVPENRQANLEFSTISGLVYTDHTLTYEKKGGGVPSEINGKLNNGGPAITLETISGDIFFRKSK